jgi:hypothetical protein
MSEVLAHLLPRVGNGAAFAALVLTSSISPLAPRLYPRAALRTVQPRLSRAAVGEQKLDRRAERFAKRRNRDDCRPALTMEEQ